MTTLPHLTKIKHEKQDEFGLKSCTFKLSDSLNPVNMIDNVVKDVLTMLSQVNQKKGTAIAVECPKFLKHYAKTGIERRTPLRLYFGKNIGEPGKIKGKRGNFVTRASYDVRPDCAAIGGDMKSSITREWTPSMKNLAGALSTAILNDDVFCEGCTGFLAFNHVSVLFYFTDPDAPQEERREVHLGYHTDVNIRPNGDSSEEKKHDQVAGTPTVVLSLGDKKLLEFKKRYVKDTKSWVKDVDQKADLGKILMHGSFHFLDPRDEQVVKRVQDEKESQFRHRVISKSKSDDKKVKACVSLCFRQVPTAMYNVRTSTLVDEEGNFIQNDTTNPKMQARDSLLKKREKELHYSKEREEIEKWLKKFHDSLRDDHAEYMKRNKNLKKRKKQNEKHRKNNKK